jgi:uncharacterized Zn-binding protein involved in type VI secretion
MILAAARAGDAVGCRTCACSVITTGCGSVVIEGKDAARFGDPTHDHDSSIRQGSATVFVGGRPATRAGDKASCRGHVVGHAQRTFIGGPRLDPDAKPHTSQPIESDAPLGVHLAYEAPLAIIAHAMTEGA